MAETDVAVVNDPQYLRNSNKKVMGMFIDRRKWLQENVAIRSLRKKMEFKEMFNLDQNLMEVRNISIIILRC